MYSFVFKNLIRVTKISDIRLRGSHGLLYMEQAKRKSARRGEALCPARCGRRSDRQVPTRRKDHSDRFLGSLAVRNILMDAGLSEDDPLSDIADVVADSLEILGMP